MDLLTLLDQYKAAKELKIAIVGETIIDRFIDVSYDGHSMKSNCPVLKLRGGESEQMGGTSAIARHLEAFVGQLDLFTNTEGEIQKTRYIDINDRSKHIEINKFDTAGFGPIHIDTTDYDAVIVADFGHGFCNELTLTDGFHLMCQTNSNNFGFNRVSKWKSYRKKSICLDLREGSLQMNRKLDAKDSEHVKELFGYEMNTEDLYLTTGATGAIYTDGNQVFRQQSFPSEIVDTIGAGDAFYAFACISSALDIDPAHRMTISALAASLTTTWLCNEYAVTPSNLQAYATRFVQNGLSKVPGN